MKPARVGDFMGFYWRVVKVSPFYRVETSFRCWGCYAFGPTMAIWYWLSGILFNRHGFGNRLECLLDTPIQCLLKAAL